MNKTATKIVNCPTCGKPVEWGPQQHWRPFCCERCRLIDLGEWADGSHRIPGDETLPDEQLTQDDGQES